MGVTVIEVHYTNVQGQSAEGKPDLEQVIGIEFLINSSLRKNLYLKRNFSFSKGLGNHRFGVTRFCDEIFIKGFIGI